jgi:hypothetical protein
MDFPESLTTADEATRRQKAREAIAAGVLPNCAPARTWGGKGVGGRCTICGDAITTQDIEFELEFGHEEPAHGKYRVHMRCFAAWELERATMSGNGHCGLSGEVLKDANGDGTMRRRERSSDNERGSP